MRLQPVRRHAWFTAAFLASLMLLPGIIRADAPKLEAAVRLSEFPDWVGSVAFSEDGKWLAAGSYRTVAIYRVEDWSLQETLRLTSGMASSLVFLPDNQHLLVGSYQRIHQFALGQSKPLAEWKGHRGQVKALSLSPDGTRVASASDDETVRVWKVSSGTTELTIEGTNGPMLGVAFSPDGKQLATASGDPERVTTAGEVRLWNAVSGEAEGTLADHKRAASAVVYLPDGKHLVSASRDETLNVHDLAKLQPRGFFGGHSRPVNSLCTVNDRVICSGSGGRAVKKNEVHLWTIDEGEILGSAEATGPVLGVAVSPDLRFVAAATQDGKVELWKMPDMKPSSLPEDASPEETGTDGDCTENAEAAVNEPGIISVGIIGLDTSHAIAFTKVLNDPKADADVANCRVIAAYPKGSPDIESSTSRVPRYTQEIRGLGVEIVDSIDALLEKVDVVLLETNDGRPHLEQLLPCLKAGKPVFIDKPIAGSLADTLAIFDAARHFKVPVFSSSSLRYSSGAQALRKGSLGRIHGAETHSPCSLEKTHPDLFWYGIHGVETLFTVMGPGCQSVTRIRTEGLDVVVGIWEGNRIGSFRGIRTGKAGYGGTAFGEKGIAPIGSYEGYRPLLVEIVKFFRTGEVPIDERETTEIYAFMEAADESKRRNGEPVKLQTVLETARKAADLRLRKLGIPD